MQNIDNYEAFLTYANQPIAVFIAKTKSCNVCKPVSEKLAYLLRDFPQVPSYEIDLEDVPAFQGQQLIFTVPTVVIFQEGKEILRESRFVDFAKIERLLTLFTS